MYNNNNTGQARAGYTLNCAPAENMFSYKLVSFGSDDTKPSLRCCCGSHQDNDGAYSFAAPSSQGTQRTVFLYPFCHGFPHVHFKTLRLGICARQPERATFQRPGLGSVHRIVNSACDRSARSRLFVRACRSLRRRESSFCETKVP